MRDRSLNQRPEFPKIVVGLSTDSGDSGVGVVVGVGVGVFIVVSGASFSRHPEKIATAMIAIIVNNTIMVCLFIFSASYYYAC